MGVIHFGTSGWRARTDEGFDEKSVGSVASALGLVWGAAADPGANAIYVGYDTRCDSERLALLVAGTLSTFGLAVHVSDAPCPTPALGRAVALDDSAIGAVSVTACDLPGEYGGIIVRGADGGTVSSSFAERVDEYATTTNAGDRGAFDRVDLVGPYLDHLASMVDAEAISRAGLRVAVDPMHGCGRGIVAALLGRLGLDVVELHGESSDDFCGLHPRPVEPWVDDCEQRVSANNCDLGVVLDGDCARAAFVSERGRLIGPHKTAPLLMEHLVERHGADGRVVMTLPCSARTMRQAERLDLELTAVPVGFARLHSEVREGDVLLACDEYGGICFPDHLPERDGILCALYMIEMVALGGRSLSATVEELAEKIGHMYYAHKDVRLDSAALQAFSNLLPGLNPRQLAGRVPVQVGHADGMKVTFENDAWVMLRPSRSLPVVRAYAEAESVADRDDLLAAACDLARGNVSESVAT